MAEMDTDPSVNIELPVRTRRPDDRAREITQAALDLFVTRGFAATKLDDVARAAGVSKGLPYLYFKSKEELGYAIIDRIRRAFIERGLEPAFADTDADPIGQLHAFFDRVLDSQRQRNCVGGCAMGNLACELSDVHEGFRQQLAGIFDVYRDHLAETIRRGQQSGRLRPDADATRVAQFLVGGLEGAILLGKVTRDITVIERCVEELKAHLALYRNGA